MSYSILRDVIKIWSRNSLIHVFPQQSELSEFSWKILVWPNITKACRTLITQSVSGSFHAVSFTQILHFPLRVNVQWSVWLVCTFQRQSYVNIADSDIVPCNVYISILSSTAVIPLAHSRFFPGKHPFGFLLSGCPKIYLRILLVISSVNLLADPEPNHGPHISNEVRITWSRLNNKDVFTAYPAPPLECEITCSWVCSHEFSILLCVRIWHMDVSLFDEIQYSISCRRR